ncbi:MAG TPA: glycosyltransferase family 4 protein [Anaerolineae bacterium]
MHILHVVQGYTPAIGGTERLIQRVSEKLVERHGDKVTVYTTTAYNCELFWRRDQPQLPASVETVNGVTVRRFSVFNRFNELRRLLAGGAYKFGLPYNDWFRALYNGPLIPGMTAAIAGSGADLVAASSFPLLHMHYALWGGRRARIPVIFYGGIHTADPFGFDRPNIYRAIRRADAYIAYTPFERDFLLERGVPAATIHVVGAGVDPEPFARADGQDLRRRFGWADAPVFAFVGQQVPHKGIDMLIEAMPCIWQERPDACLLIAGAATTYSAFIRQWISQLTPDFRSRVAVVDNFAEDEKPNVFAACDVLVFPSGHESFGIVLLEAWAAGKPVIASRTGAIPSVVDEGKDGLLIRHRDVGDLVEAMQALLGQPELRRRMGQYGRQKVEQRYTWDIVADKLRQVYLQTQTRRVATAAETTAR